MAEALAYSNVVADYDSLGDTLYFVLGKPKPGYGDAGYRDIIFRFSSDDEKPIGATIVGYEATHWSNRKAELAEAVGKHLHVPPALVISALKEIGL